VRKTLAALAALAVLSGCVSLAPDEDVPAGIEAALQAYAVAEGKEMKGTWLQLLGPTATQRGTFRQRARLADGKVVESNGTFEAEWERQADGSWLLSRMTANPPPMEIPRAGETP
jgi:ketosteroid isomerase-like protein